MFLHNIDVDTVAKLNPTLPSPLEYVWREEAMGFSPAMTTMDSDSEAILHLVKC